MKNSFLAILAILSIAVFFRFWKLEERTLFSGEATAEFVVLRNIATGKQSPLLGYSIAPYVKGGLYTTPWVWWILAPIWKLTDGNPSVFIVLHPLVGVVSIWLLYRAGVLFYSKKAGLFAALIYASSMTIANVDRSIWSPSFIAPLVNSALFFLAKTLTSSGKKWPLLLGIALGLFPSLHFVTLLLCALFSGIVFWRKRKLFLWSLLPLFLSFLPLLAYDLIHEFVLVSALFKALAGFGDGTRTYSFSYFFYQFYPILILIAAIALTKVHRHISIGAVSLFLIWQTNLFLTYRVSPNYKERKALILTLLEFWRKEQSITIYMNDKPFFEYGYLFLFLGQDDGVIEDSITVLTPSPEDKERAFQLVRQKARDLDSVPLHDVEALLKLKKGVLVLDQDKLKILPYSSLTL